MKPQYGTLKRNHYSSNQYSMDFVDAKTLYEELGYNLTDLTKQNPNYVNTCATRMSLALLKSGINCGGRLKIKKGSLEGRSFEPGAKLLADKLSSSTLFGKPQIYQPNDFLKSPTNKRGVVFFWKINNYGGGHIDLIEISNASALCHSNCFFSCKEVWFWKF